ncbi:hypothetical protein SAMN06264364_1431 [Quadrisphaera granulorum]|uniref:Uncharacterized protein n=1 Tax=Quadrisphaera granulorum TaxID=317664 RepID=A0A315ZQM5_9ACTN|nr:hypothetical protein BXY45_1431 [Quadrisphaera granulorum]SZE98960.1 hypothetical protein SAMN06264364_1431 [Quadrisphaera granulorum]
MLVPVLVVGGTALALLGGPVASVVVYSGSYDPTPVGEPASPFALVLSAQQTTGAGLVVLGLLLAALLVGRRWGARSAR